MTIHQVCQSLLLTAVVLCLCGSAPAKARSSELCLDDSVQPQLLAQAQPAEQADRPTVVRLTSSPIGNRAYYNPLTIGFDLTGAAIRSEDSLFGTAVGQFALDIMFTFTEKWSFGISQLHLSAATVVDDNRWGWGFAPTASWHTFLTRWFQFLAHGGLAYQQRLGAELDNSWSLSPFVGAEGRFWFSDLFSIGILTRLGVVAGDAYLFNSRVLPGGALVQTIGLTFNFHLFSRSDGSSSRPIIINPRPDQQPSPGPQMMEVWSW